MSFDKKRKLLVDASGYPINQFTMAAPEQASVSDAVEQEIQIDLSPYAKKTAFSDSTGSVPSIPASNLIPANFFKFRSAISKKLYGGSGAVKIMCIGDSTTIGYNSTGGLNNANGIGPWPVQLKNKIRDNLFPPTKVTFGMPVDPAGACSDGRYVLSGGWRYYNASGSSVGWGNMGFFYNARDGTGTIQFTPGYTFDTVRVYYPKAMNNQDQTVTIGGVTQATVVNQRINGTATVNDINYQEYTVTAQNSAITIAVNAGTGTNPGDNFCLGIDAFLSTASEIRVANVGVNASKAAQWGSTTTFTSSSCIQLYAPDLTIICLGKNDALVSSSTANFQTWMTTIINAAKASGDVIICSILPSGSDQTNRLLWEPQYNSILQSLAVSQKCGFVDISARLGTWAQANAKGWETDTTGHMNDGGYEDFAHAVNDAIRVILHGNALT